MVVLDASVALEWLLPSERSGEVEQLILQAKPSGVHAPAIFPLEVANGLRTKVRQGKITADYRDIALDRLYRLGVEADQQGSRFDRLREAVGLSDRFGLTVYDASYLELALRLGADLASLDRELAAAARASGLQVHPD